MSMRREAIAQSGLRLPGHRGCLLVARALVLAFVSAAVATRGGAQQLTPVEVELISVSIVGTSGNASSSGVAANFEGNVVAFYSNATDLVRGDTNQVRDVFLRDRVHAMTERISLNSMGEQGNRASHATGFPPAIDADGQIAAFYSEATNLVPDDTNDQSDVFVRLRSASKTERVSVSADGQQGNGPSLNPSISGDGQLVAFQSRASNLTTNDQNGLSDIFVRDRGNSTTERICDSVEPNGFSYAPSISANGRFVAFTSAATNLVPGRPDLNGQLDIFVCDRTTGAIDLASVSTEGVQGNGDSILPAISEDSRFVAFKSLASNLVPDDRNGVVDVFVRDRVAHTTERISVSFFGGNANDASFPPSISYDGRFVAFGSAASNIVRADVNQLPSVFVRDRMFNLTLLVDVNAHGDQANGAASDVPPSVSGDGRQIGYVSFASNLAGPDRNETSDVFIAGNPFFCPGGICPPDLMCQGGMCMPEVVPTPTPTATGPTATRTATATATATGPTATRTATATATGPTTTPTATPTGPTATATPTGPTATQTGTTTPTGPTATQTGTTTPTGPTATQTGTTTPTGPTATQTGTTTPTGPTATQTGTTTPTGPTATQTGTTTPTGPTATQTATATGPTTTPTATATALGPTATLTATVGTSDCCQCEGTCAAPSGGACPPGCNPVRQAACLSTGACATFTPVGPTATATATTAVSPTRTRTAIGSPTPTFTPGGGGLDQDACQCAVAPNPQRTRRGILLWLSGPAMLLLRRWRRRSGRGSPNSLLRLILVAAVVAAGPARAAGPFIGVDLGVSEPTDGNYRAHVKTGGTFNPYVGYMFNKYLGLEGQLQVVVQSIDEHSNFPDNNKQTTTMLGGTGGPRFVLPFRYPFDLGDGEIYATAQGGYFTGLSGRLSQSAPGFSTGAGLGYKLTPALTVEAFGRWNTSFMSPRPKDLGPGQVPQERFGDDIEWFTGGFGMMYEFPEAPPAPPQPPVAQLPPVAPPLQKKIVLRNVLFDFDRSDIRPDSAPVLDEAVALLKEAGNITIIAEGHTDSIGTEAYNLKLSLRRANAVRQYLIDHGIAADRIRAEGLGESRPVASNATAEGRAQNRRVELRVIQ